LRGAAHIRLKDREAVACCLGSLVEPRFGDRRKDDAIAEGARRLGDGGTPARVEDLQRADRRTQHGDAHLFAEQRAAAIDVRDIAQYPRPKPYRIERQAVARQGRLGLGAADQIVPIVAIEIGARLRDKLVQVQETAFERLGHGLVLPR
jgi:hypothetical protein